MISVIFGGDVSPKAGPAASSLISRGELWDEYVREFVSTADYRVVNLETTLGMTSTKRLKIGVNLQTLSGIGSVLAKSMVNMVSLANNHIFDFGIDGVLQTTRLLDKEQIKYGGIGKTPADADQLSIININGEKIGFLFYAEHEFNYISSSEPGTAILDPSSIVLKIQESKSVCDYVVLFTHFGPEGTDSPSPRMVKLFRDFIRAGASAVINCHAHHIMGMEFYDNKPIYYGLGNLFFPNDKMPDWWYQGILVKINFSKNGITTEELFTSFKETNYVSADIDQMNSMLKFQEISSWLKTPEIITQKWINFCKEQTPHMFSQLLKAFIALIPYIIAQKMHIRFRKKKSLNSLPAKGARVLRGLFSCENHTEELTEIFTELGLRE